MLKCDDDPVLPPPPAVPSHSLTFMHFQEAVHEKGALVGALQHQANILVTIVAYCCLSTTKMI